MHLTHDRDLRLEVHDPTSRQFSRAGTLGAAVTLTWPWNPFNNKIGGAATGMVHPSYRTTRNVHPSVGPSGF